MTTKYSVGRLNEWESSNFTTATSALAYVHAGHIYVLIKGKRNPKRGASVPEDSFSFSVVCNFHDNYILNKEMRT